MAMMGIAVAMGAAIGVFILFATQVWHSGEDPPPISNLAGVSNDTQVVGVACSGYLFTL